MAMEIPGFYEGLNASLWMSRKAIDARVRRMREAWLNPTTTRERWNERVFSQWVFFSLCGFFVCASAAFILVHANISLLDQWRAGCVVMLASWATGYKLALGVRAKTQVIETHLACLLVGLFGLGCAGLLHTIMDKSFAVALYRLITSAGIIFLVLAWFSPVFSLVSGLACRLLHQNGIGLEITPGDISALLAWCNQSPQDRDVLEKWLALSPDGVPTTRMWCLVDQIRRPAHWWAPFLTVFHSGFVWLGSGDEKIHQMRLQLEDRMPGITDRVQALAQSSALDALTPAASPSASPGRRRI